MLVDLLIIIKLIDCMVLVIGDNVLIENGIFCFLFGVMFIVGMLISCIFDGVFIVIL